MTRSTIDFTPLNTDFNYDALGGFGKVQVEGQLGTHSMEVLEAPGARQSNRIAGPPKTIGRWFSKLLDTLTLRNVRQHGKYHRGLEDFSALTGRLMGRMADLKTLHGVDSNEANKLRQQCLNDIRKDLAALRSTAEPMTKRGAVLKEIIDTRVQCNVEILRRENNMVLKDSKEIDDIFTEIEQNLHPQDEMQEDLQNFRDALERAIQGRSTGGGAPNEAPVPTRSEAEAGPSQPSGSDSPAKANPMLEMIKVYAPEAGKVQNKLEVFSTRTGQLLSKMASLHALEGEEKERAQLLKGISNDLKALGSTASEIAAQDKSFTLPMLVDAGIDINMQLLPDGVKTGLKKLVTSGELDGMIADIGKNLGDGKMRDGLQALQHALRTGVLLSTNKDGSLRTDGISAEDRMRELQTALAGDEPTDIAAAPPTTTTTVSPDGASPATGSKQANAAKAIRVATNMIKKTLDENLPAADPKSFDLVRAHIKGLIQEASDEALQHMSDASRSVLAPDQLKRDLDSVGTAMTDAMSETRKGIKELFNLYDDMLKALNPVQDRFDKLEWAAQLLNSERQKGAEGRRHWQDANEAVRQVIHPDSFKIALPSSYTGKVRDNMAISPEVPDPDRLGTVQLPPSLKRMNPNEGTTGSLFRIMSRIFSGDARSPSLKQAHDDLQNLQADFDKRISQQHYLERSQVFNQAASDAANLLSQAGVPNNNLDGQVRQICRLMDNVQTNTVPLQRQVARFMAGVAQARMQIICPDAAAATLDGLEWKNASAESKNKALKALDLLQKSVALKVQDLIAQNPGNEQCKNMGTVLQASLDTIEAAKTAATKCSEIANPTDNMKKAFKQLAISVSSARADGADTLKEMLKDRSWEKDPKAKEAKAAIEAFLAGRDKLIAGRAQNGLLIDAESNNFGIGGETLKKYNIVPHDICRDTNGQLCMLINRRGMGNTNDLLWVRLPNPAPINNMSTNRPMPKYIKRFQEQVKKEDLPDRFKDYLGLTLKGRLFGGNPDDMATHYARMHRKITELGY